jgi:hypothetical protein
MTPDRNEDESPAGGGRGREPSAAERVGERPADAGPLKKHGDALAAGSGTRHGVEERDERPAADGGGDSP